MDSTVESEKDIKRTVKKDKWKRVKMQVLR